MKLALWLTLLLAGISGSAHADRDIIYAARYYALPGSHRTSHFHLYRVNPDGSGRTQLTFGRMDESAPRWSPDGQQILFTREASTGHSLLCLVAARDGAVSKVMERGKPSGEDGYLYRCSPGAHRGRDVRGLCRQPPNVGVFAGHANAAGAAFARRDGFFLVARRQAFLHRAGPGYAAVLEMAGRNRSHGLGRAAASWLSQRQQIEDDLARAGLGHRGRLAQENTMTRPAKI